MQIPYSGASVDSGIYTSDYNADVECSLTGKATDRPGHSVWHWMHALGRDALPARVTVGGRDYAIGQFVKHDFFAATGFYDAIDTGERIVVKFGRAVSIFGLPTAWIGRWLTRREMRFYERLADLPNVPRLLGRVGATGFAHAYAPGRPLQAGTATTAEFFNEMHAIIDAIAKRGIAIVDTNKPENIILGDDGRPHLIDFQISYDTRDLFNLWPAGPLLRLFVKTDHYHVQKHKSRLRPDLTTDEERAAVARRSWPIRLHRRLTRPYFILRRRLFAHLRATGRLMREGSK